MTDVLDWRVYERVVASLEVGRRGEWLSITPNASVIGRYSGVSRQLDILIDALREGRVEQRIVYDAKLRRRRIDVKEVEAFEGMMRDVEADRGVLVASSGFTKAAVSRAEQAIMLRLLTVEEALNHAPRLDACSKCIAQKERKRAGAVFWTKHMGMISLGKCDVCRDFHVQCHACHEQAVLGDFEDFTCRCGGRVFYVDNDGISKALIFALEGSREGIWLDRFPVTAASARFTPSMI